MSRKDYIAIARAINQTREETANILGSYSVLKNAATKIARELSDDNIRFNSTKFMDACGFPKS